MDLEKSDLGEDQENEYEDVEQRGEEEAEGDYEDVLDPPHAAGEFGSLGFLPPQHISHLSLLCAHSATTSVQALTTSPQ